MPYKNKEYHRYRRRVLRREQRHPGWRQTFVDCDGECQWLLEEGGMCRERDTLEFHHKWVKQHRNGDGWKEEETLLCLKHHQEEHDGICNERHYPSMLQEDVLFEINVEGSTKQWMKKYGLKERVVV